MKNLEFTLNLNQLKRELILKEEKLEKLQIQSSLTISNQSEQIKAAEMKIEKLENMLITSRKQVEQPITSVPAKYPTPKPVVERVEIPVEGPDWKAIVEQLKIQLKLKTDIIKNMQKLQHSKIEPKPVFKNVIERSCQTEVEFKDNANEPLLRKELNYFKVMHENQEILKEEIYSLRAKADSLQAQSLENESLKLKLSELQKEVERRNDMYSKSVEEMTKKQSEIEHLTIEVEKAKMEGLENLSKYQKSLESLSIELQESRSNAKRMERLRETFQFEIRLLKENLKSFDMEINQMTALKLDSLKEKRIQDLEEIIEKYSAVLSQMGGSQLIIKPELERQVDIAENKRLKEEFTQKIALYQRSIENLFGNCLLI
jgi:hypothetical protein